jgi:hypothetical protein
VPFQGETFRFFQTARIFGIEEYLTEPYFAACFAEQVPELLPGGVHGDLRSS